MFDPLSNPRTSAVLLLAIRGVDTPTGIARELDVKPPAVMDQLHKLRRVRVVRMGRKTGKEQHYEVDWDTLAREVVRRTLAPRYLPGEFRDADAARFVKSYPGFKRFLATYFGVMLSALADQSKDSQKRLLTHYESFSDFVNQLHSTLTVMTARGLLFGKLVMDDPSLEQFSKPLRDWVSKSQPVDMMTVEFLRYTLEELGFKRGENVTTA